MEQFDFSSLANYGALGIMLIFFIYKDLKTNKENRDAQEKRDAETRTTLEGVKDALNGLKEVVAILKEVIDRK